MFNGTAWGEESQTSFENAFKKKFSEARFVGYPMETRIEAAWRGVCSAQVIARTRFAAKSTNAGDRDSWRCVEGVTRRRARVAGKPWAGMLHLRKASNPSLVHGNSDPVLASLLRQAIPRGLIGAVMLAVDRGLRLAPTGIGSGLARKDPDVVRPLGLNPSAAPRVPPTDVCPPVQGLQRLPVYGGPTVNFGAPSSVH